MVIRKHRKVVAAVCAFWSNWWTGNPGAQRCQTRTILPWYDASATSRPEPMQVVPHPTPTKHPIGAGRMWPQVPRLAISRASSSAQACIEFPCTTDEPFVLSKLTG